MVTVAEDSSAGGLRRRKLQGGSGVSPLGANDPVTGLYYERARWYSARLAVLRQESKSRYTAGAVHREISQDPLQYINGANTYQFVGDGPVGGVDPSGRQAYMGGYPGVYPGEGVIPTAQQLMETGMPANQAINAVNSMEAGAAQSWQAVANGAAVAGADAVHGISVAGHAVTSAATFALNSVTEAVLTAEGMPIQQMPPLITSQQVGAVEEIGGGISSVVGGAMLMAGSVVDFGTTGALGYVMFNAGLLAAAAGIDGLLASFLGASHSQVGDVLGIGNLATLGNDFAGSQGRLAGATTQLMVDASQLVSDVDRDNIFGAADDAATVVGDLGDVIEALLGIGQGQGPGHGFGQGSCGEGSR